MAKFDKFDYNRLLEDNGTQVVDIIRYNENFELVSMDIHFLNSGEGEFRLDINEIKALLRKSGTVWFKNIGFTATKDKKTGEYRYYWSGTGNGKRNTAFKINLRIDEDIESDLEKLYKYRNFRLKKVYYYDNKSINQVCTTRSTIITKAVFSITENGQSKEIELSAKDILRQLRFDRNSRFMTDADLDLFNVKDGGAIELNILKKGIPDLGSIPNLGVIIEQDREAARWQNAMAVVGKAADYSIAGGKLISCKSTEKELKLPRVYSIFLYAFMNSSVTKIILPPTIIKLPCAKKKEVRESKGYWAEGTKLLNKFDQEIEVDTSNTELLYPEIKNPTDTQILLMINSIRDSRVDFNSKEYTFIEF